MSINFIHQQPSNKHLTLCQLFLILGEQEWGRASFQIGESDLIPLIREGRIRYCPVIQQVRYIYDQPFDICPKTYLQSTILETLSSPYQAVSMTGLLSLSGHTSLCLSELEPAKDTVTRSQLELTVETESRLARARHKKLQKRITFFIFFLRHKN